MNVQSVIPTVGQIIADRYEIERTLGEGGMGLVYVARDRVLGRQVALKVLWPRYAAEADAYVRFQREARVASTLQHPNAVQIYDFGRSGNLLYIAMEMLRGTSLSAAMRTWEALDCAQAIRIGYQVADVLTTAHALPMIHRDIKPENIFLDQSTTQERVVVLDFGLAFVLDTDDQSVGRLTTDNMIMGTPFYMSPEQACNATLGPASDIYSLGCMLFELAAGRPPFFYQAPAKVLTEHLYAPAPLLRDYNPNAPAALEELVTRMLAKQPDKRPTADQVRKRLAAFEPGSLEVRDRSRDASYLSNRKARMVSRPVDRDQTLKDMQASATRLAIVGACDTELLVALGVSAIGAQRVKRLDRAAVGFDAIFVTAEVGTDLAPAVAAGVPVLAESAPGDIRRITELLRAGVSEVVLRPVQPDDLVRKVKRAIRKSRSLRPGGR